MPLNRYQIRNEYSLADPELYKVADKDDPEALLEGVAMAGLVGVLRQLGDLAEFAAEIFHDLHEEVMATAARGHGLIIRVQQLEAEIPPIERTLLSQTSHTSFLYNTGVDWHSNLRMDQGVVTRGDLPRFVMDSYEECRGPPRLFLLDKFDVAGAGACLKRFTDPSFFKTESTTLNGRKLDRQREKKTRRVKKRGPRWRNGDTPESFSSSHAKLHQLFLEERIESCINDPVRRVKLKKRQFTGSLFDQDNVRSYMEIFLDSSPQEQKTLHEICIDPLALTWTSENACDAGLEVVEIGTISPVKESVPTDRSLCFSPDAKDTVVKPSLGDCITDKLNLITDSELVEGPGIYHETPDGNASNILKMMSGETIADRKSMSEVSIGDACDFDDGASEIDNYVDALANIESEVETDSDSKKNPRYSNLKPFMAGSDGSERQRLIHSLSLDSQSIGNSITSEDGDHLSKERESSSCSNSVNTLTEITPDLDAAAMTVTAIQASNSESGNMLFDHHSTSEEILITEREKHAAAFVHAEVDGVLKSEQDFVDTLNTSSPADVNMEVAPVDMEASLKEKPLPDPETEDSARLDAVLLETDIGVTNQIGILPSQRAFSDTSENSGHYISVVPSIHDKEGQNPHVYSDTSSGRSNVFNGLVHLLETDSQGSASSLVARHDKDLGMADIDACFDSGRTSLDFAALNLQCSQDNPSMEDSIFVSEENVTSALHVDQAGKLPAICSQMHTCVQEFSSSEIAKAAELTECGSFEADIVVVSSWDEPNSEVSGSADEAVNDSPMVGNPTPIVDPLEAQNEFLKIPSDASHATDTTLPELCQDEACRQYSGNDTCNGCSISVSGNEGEVASHAGLFKREQDFAFIYPDQTQAFESDTPVDNPESLIATVQGVARGDHASADQHGDVDKIFSHDASSLDNPCKHADYSDHALVSGNNLYLNHDVEKVEHRETVADGPGEVDVEYYCHQNGTTLSTSLSLHPEELRESPPFVTKLFCQDDEELTNGHGATLTERMQIDPGQDAFVTSTANMCNFSDDFSSVLLDGSQPEDVQNNGKLAVETEDLGSLSHKLLNSHLVEQEEDASVTALHNYEQPTVSKISPPAAEHTPDTSNLVFHGDGMLSDGNQAMQLEKSGQPFCHQGLLPDEPRINLEPPSLPPLPPMQWRLGRFQNSAAVPPGRQMVQHTRVPVQVQPISLPTTHHTLAPVQSMNLPAVHHAIASFQPVGLTAVNSTLAPNPPTILPLSPPAIHYTLSPLQPVTLPTSNYGTATIARTLTSDGQLGYSDAYVAQQGVFALPLPVGVSDGLFQINSSAVGRQDSLPSTVPLVSTNLDAYVTQQGIFTPSNPAMVSEGVFQPQQGLVSEGSSQIKTSEVGKEDQLLFTVSSASTMSANGTQLSEEPFQPNVEDPESGSLVEGHFSEHTSTEEEEVNSGSSVQNELLEHRSQVLKEEVGNQAPLGLVAPEAGITWSSAYDEIPTYADDNTNGTLQKKPPRPRNPLIVEVVAIDKSKLRKVERTKASVESKPEEGESLLEQMQLRKVERVKPLAESKVEGGEYVMEQLQLRKVGERVKPPIEQKTEEEFSLEQLQLRKVGERVKPPVEPKSEEREFLLEQLQLRKVGVKSKQEVDQKIEETESPQAQLRKVRERVRDELELKAEETESPRMQLRKVSERPHPPAGEKAEERDSLFEQIRNKSFNLKPAVAARPNIQGPRTNLKVAAILEKASTIRQAMAGSDEDEDADNWSDS